MNSPVVLSSDKRRRGNPNWGKPLRLRVLRTEFEIQVERLGLTEAEYTNSAQLKHWCELNRNRVYVPEWLLEQWEMTVEAIFSGVV